MMPGGQRQSNWSGFKVTQVAHRLRQGFDTHRSTVSVGVIVDGVGLRVEGVSESVVVGVSDDGV